MLYREAAEEIRVGKGRSMNSLYAQEIRKYLEQRGQNLRSYPQTLLLKWS